MQQVQLSDYYVFQAIGIQVFDKPQSFEDYIALRVQLDSSDDGLSQEQFRDMFGQCRGCGRFVMMRNKDHHRCPGKYGLSQLGSDEDLFFLLDSTAGGQGLTLGQFCYLFLSCISCGRVFTRGTGSRHVHFEDN